MTKQDNISEAISLLQELGLQEYEARCFMALTRINTGTAKDIHEISDVPRTRVYDALRVLESQGLVEIQHSSPQKFRSVGIDEATQILQQKYENRIDTLETHLEDAEKPEVDDEADQIQEVWALSGHETIETRTCNLIEEAESEVALLVVDEDLLTEEVFDALHDTIDRDVGVIVGGLTESIISRVRSELPSAQVFETELEWLVGAEADTEVAISRVLFIDRETLLIASFYPGTGETDGKEQAVFARGLTNGFVVLIRRLLSSGLAETRDITA